MRQAEIDYIESCGVEIRYDSPIVARHTVNDLLKEGYKAVFIGAGAQSSKRIGILGEDESLIGLHYGLRFLTDVKSGIEVVLGGRVVVLGGGNVAIDVARTAFRVGARDVQLFCLEAREDMPAWQKEVSEALEEGIVINPSWGPKRILDDKGRVTGIEFVRCVSVFDGEGRFNPSFDEENWINLITPVPAGIVYPLVEGLKNEVICRDNRIRGLVPVELTPMDAAICTALAETAAGPGKLPSRQACFAGR